MTWYAVYDTNSGELRSVGTEVADPLPGRMSKYEIIGYDGERPPPGLWDPAAKTWDLTAVPPEPEVTTDPAPISRREMVRILMAQGMTQEEAIAVVTGAREEGG